MPTPTANTNASADDHAAAGTDGHTDTHANTELEGRAFLVRGPGIPRVARGPGIPLEGLVFLVSLEGRVFLARGPGVPRVEGRVFLV